MRIICMDGTSLRTVSAMVTSSALGTPKLRPLRMVLATASSTFGWAWPAIIGPQLPM